MVVELFSRAPSLLEQAGLWVQIVVAVATMLSVGVIAWQSVMTRRSVQLTAEALKVAQDEAQLNREGMVLAREDAELRVAQMGHERRAWVDSMQPVLTVDLDEDVRWSLVSPIGIFGDVDRGRDVNGVPILRLDEHSAVDLGKKVGGRIVGSIANDAGSRAVCEFFDRDGTLVGHVAVSVGESQDFQFPVEYSAEEWMRRYRADVETNWSYFVGSFRYVSSGSRGVVMSWPIFMTGSLLVPEGVGSDYWIGGSWDGSFPPTAKVHIPGEMIDRQYFFDFVERLNLLKSVQEAYTAKNLDDPFIDAGD